MAAIYNHISPNAPAARRPARQTTLAANALRRAQDIFCALWLLAAVAFSLLIAAGFVA